MGNNKNDIFCIECGEKRQFTVKTVKEELTIRGITFSYPEQKAYCCACGEEVYVPEINDMNAQAREDAYRKAARLITVSEIKDIEGKYNIGAEPLAILLGFGKITINRYISGQLPSKEYSERLLEVRASYRKMEEYLEKGKDLISDVAYEKCRKTIDRFADLYGNGKIETVTRYILCRTVDITPLALQKLLYYAQAFFHAIFHEDLFTDECQAWSFGPVYPDVYYRYREYGYNPIDKPTAELESDFSELTIRETELINAVIDAFGQYSGKVLSKITHNERPWLEARGPLQVEDRSVTVIGRQTINEYFDSVISKYGITSPCEIKKYTIEMLKIAGAN